MNLHQRQFKHDVTLATNYVYRELPEGKVYAFMAINQAAVVTGTAYDLLRNSTVWAAERARETRIPADPNGIDVEHRSVAWVPTIKVLLGDGSEHIGLVVLDDQYNFTGILEGENLISLVRETTMFLALELPGMDKGVSLFARDLADDEGFDPVDGTYSYDSDRSRVYSAVTRANKALGKDRSNAFCSLFNQFSWEGTSGWEYWSDDFQLMLKHALIVARVFGIPLHVHQNIMDKVLDAAIAAGIKLDFQVAREVVKPNTSEFGHINRQIAKGEYFVLTDVVLPEGTPILEGFDD